MYDNRRDYLTDERLTAKGSKHKFKPLKPSQKIRVAYMNGCRTAADYAAYIKKNKRPNKTITGEF